jgi:ribosomal protein S18 acetylase RimI-like enzyme
MSVEIRPVRPDEYELAGRVTADAYREYARGDDWPDYLERLADVAGRAQRTTVLVAVEGDRILGTVTLELDRRVEEERQDHLEAQRLPAHECHIRMLAVAPVAQRRGIGRALMEECMRIARENGKTMMTLNTAARMEAARRMYEAMGFERLPDWNESEDFPLLLRFAISLA